MAVAADRLTLCYPVIPGNIARMPVRFVLPLPGPFYWVPRQRTHRPAAHRTVRHTLGYWLLGGWAIEAAFWVTAFVLIASFWLTWWGLRIAAAVLLFAVGITIEWWQQRRTVGEPVGPQDAVPHDRGETDHG